MKWRFLDTGFNSGAFNMTYDISLASEFATGSSLPTLRVYGWQPHAISIGMNQRLEDFDMSKLAAAGIDIVRRPTGGRAILHADELTYSVAMNAGGRSLRELYRFINEGVACGLRLLGIDVQLSGQSHDFRTHYRDLSAIPCFTSSAKDEIHYQQRKLVGSAQRRFGNTILQHGSLLLGSRHRHLIEFLSGSINGSRAVILENLDSSSVDAQTILGRVVSYDEAADAVRRGFENACGIEFIGTMIDVAS
ncbi:MAG TPA: lipoate--protein ligase family protein [Bacteroidota bacterium]|jgi:lipoate-protein ligase A|nr:lipoate--protein ligase family protein [Bacteroidota bacterium]